MLKVTVKNSGAEIIPQKKYSPFFVRVLDSHGLIENPGIDIDKSGFFSSIPYFGAYEAYKTPYRNNMGFVLKMIESGELEAVSPLTAATLIADESAIELIVEISKEELAEAYVSVVNEKVSLVAFRYLLKILARFYHKDISEENMERLYNLQKDIEKSIYQEKFYVRETSLNDFLDVLGNLSESVDIATSANIINKLIQWTEGLLRYQNYKHRKVNIQEGFLVELSEEGKKEIKRDFLS